MVINARYNITLFPGLLDCHLFFWHLLPCIILMASDIANIPQIWSRLAG